MEHHERNKGKAERSDGAERRGEGIKYRENGGGGCNSMDVGLKLGMYGLSMQSYGGLLEAVVSDFIVTFRHLGEEPEEIRQKYQDNRFCGRGVRKEFSK
jgi:hypothetical protein